MAKDARNAEKHAALEMLKTGMNSHVPQIIRAALLEAGSRLGPVLLTLECTLKKKNRHRVYQMQMPLLTLDHGLGLGQGLRLCILNKPHQGAIHFLTFFLVPRF